MTTVPRRGDVWLAELDKLRPLIVLTRNPMGRYLNAVIVAPVTSTVRGLSTEVAVGPADGIRAPSVANLDNLQLIGRERLRRRVGHATPDTMAALCRALAIAVDCPAASRRFTGNREIPESPSGGNRPTLGE